MAKRVFFSFHYQDFIDRRVDVVRNHWLANEGAEDAGVFEEATWDEASMYGQLGIKRLIDGGLENTSVTCVLIGAQTFARRWVRYEIVQSILRGNLLLGIHINGIPDKLQRTKPEGRSPFEHLALSIAGDGTSVQVLQYSNAGWIPYEDTAGWPLSKPAAAEKRGKRLQLSTMYRVYDWTNGYGPENFTRWIGVK